MTSAPRPRILVCDDSATIRGLIVTLLGDRYEFVEAISGEEGLARSLTCEPDLIISDVMMEGMDGYELCRRVRAEPRLQNVSFILLTSKNDAGARATGLEVGADDYLFKPIRPRELAARVDSLLRLRQATLELERRSRQLEEANRELQQAQSAIVQQEKLASLGQLVAGIAHELNNPLNFCLGNTEFLQEYVDTLLGLNDRFDGLPGLTEPQRAAIAAWRQEADLEFLRTDLRKLITSTRIGAQRASAIVRDLRAFARVGTGQLEELDVPTTVEMALTVIGHELRDRIELQRDYAPVGKVRGEASRLGQVFVNVLLNASQAIADKGKITIAIGEVNGFVRCSVRDSGCGMPPEVRAKIFDPFFTTKPVGKGTGLGLSISYGIVQQHGGRIEVESQPGAGTEFVILLPAVPRA